MITNIYQSGLLFYLAVILVWIIASYNDLKTKGDRVPNYLSLIMMGTAILNPNFNAIGAILGFATGFSIFMGACLINYLICKMKKIPCSIGIGGADIKLSASFGLAICSWETVLIMATVAVWAALIKKTILIMGSILLKKPNEMKPTLFVPYLTVGAVIGMLII